MAGKRRKEAEPDGGRDPLGKPLARYTARRSGLLVILAAVALGLSGGFVLGAAARLAHSLAQSDDDMPYTVVGWGLVLIGTATMAGGVLQLGRTFEVRRKGVRFTRRSFVQELRWDEIVDIQVRKTLVYYRGSKVGVRWEVELIGDYDTISLGPSFLRQISSVTELVNLLKHCSGKEVLLPPLV